MKAGLPAGHEVAGVSMGCFFLAPNKALKAKADANPMPTPARSEGICFLERAMLPPNRPKKILDHVAKNRGFASVLAI